MDFFGGKDFFEEDPLDELFGTFSLQEAYNSTPTPGPHLLDACILGVT